MNSDFEEIWFIAFLDARSNVLGEGHRSSEAAEESNQHSWLAVPLGHQVRSHVDVQRTQIAGLVGTLEPSEALASKAILTIALMFPATVCDQRSSEVGMPPRESGSATFRS